MRVCPFFKVEIMTHPTDHSNVQFLLDALLPRLWLPLHTTATRGLSIIFILIPILIIPILIRILIISASSSTLNLEEEKMCERDQKII